MIEGAFAIILLILATFPAWFIFLRKGANKFLYISSVVGSATVIQLLAAGVLLPAAILVVYIYPNLEAQGLTKNITYLYDTAEFIQSYFWLSIPVLHVVMSLAIYRRYELFRAGT